MAVKKAHATMVAKEAPPGSQPVQAWARRIRRPGASSASENHPDQREEGDTGEVRLRRDHIDLIGDRGNGRLAEEEQE